MSKKPVAMVIQRFGPTIIGGAESYASDLATQLYAQTGHEVHIYTTCAQSHRSWANELPPFEDVTSFGKILRFKTKFNRWPAFGIISRGLIFLRQILIYLRLPPSWISAVESAWFVAQGPYTPSLMDALTKNQDAYECVIAVTYLYWPTLAAMETLHIRKLLIPLAHDEAPFYFNRVRKALELADCVLSNVVPEASLIKRVAPKAKIAVAGAGIRVDELKVPEKNTLEPKKPYLLYLGRISRGKNVDQLIRWLDCDELKALDLSLVLAGHVEEDMKYLLRQKHVKYVGQVSTQDKIKLIAEAFAVVNPSSHESLSLITLEAMALGTPAIVNEESDVLAYYAQQVPTCFSFTDQKSLISGLRRLKEGTLSKGWVNDLDQAKQWTRANFDWQNVIKNFELAIKGRLYETKPF